jgi:hypothetical protein
MEKPMTPQLCMITTNPDGTHNVVPVDLDHRVNVDLKSIRIYDLVVLLVRLAVASLFAAPIIGAVYLFLAGVGTIMVGMVGRS